MKLALIIGAGLLILVGIGAGVAYLMWPKTTSDLAKIQCEKGSIEVKEWYVEDTFTGPHSERYIWYEPGNGPAKQGKEIAVKADGFPVAFAPEHFQWFEETTVTKKKSPSYEAYNLTLYAPADDMPESFLHSKEDVSSGYRGFGYFSEEEFEDVLSCLTEHRELVEAKLQSWYQDRDTGEGYVLPVRIASVSYVPVVSVKDSYMPGPSWGPRSPEFVCGEGGKIQAFQDGRIILTPGNVTVGTLDEKGFFTKNITDYRPEMVARAEQTISGTSSCVNSDGKTLEQFYQAWREAHSAQFMPAQ
jgi:hypothetical protein